MQCTFTLKKDELNFDFIKGLKKIFKGNVLDITVSDNSDASNDETEYLLGNPANKKFLLEGIAEIEKGNVKKIEASSQWLQLWLFFPARNIISKRKEKL